MKAHTQDRVLRHLRNLEHYLTELPERSEAMADAETDILSSSERYAFLLGVHKEAVKFLREELGVVIADMTERDEVRA